MTNTNTEQRSSNAVIFFGSQQPMKYITLPIPLLREGEVLVRVEYTTICRSDLHTFEGKRQEKTPTILGHEVVGFIEEIAENGTAIDAAGFVLQVGDRVTWGIFAADPHDPMSLRGMPQKADGLFKYGHARITESEHLHGGMASHCILRKYTPIVKISNNIPRGVASILNCACATSAGALRLAGVLEGKRILLIGAGMLGLCAAAMAKELDAHVYVQDVSSKRILQAADFGADADDLGEMDVVIDFSGNPDAMENGIERLRTGGSLVLVGAVMNVGRVSFDPERVIRRLLNMRGLHNYNVDDLLAAVNFMERNIHRYPFDRLIEHGGRLTEAQTIFKNAVSSTSFRVGIEP